MTKTEIIKAAKAEAREMIATKRTPARDAIMFGFRRVYNKIERDRFVAAQLALPETPKFMWLRGW